MHFWNQWFSKWKVDHGRKESAGQRKRQERHREKTESAQDPLEQLVLWAQAHYLEDRMMSLSKVSSYWSVIHQDGEWWLKLDWDVWKYFSGQILNLYPFHPTLAPFPTVSGPHIGSLCLDLYSCPANRFICTIFLEPIYKQYYTMFAFLFLTYFTLYDRTLGPSMSLQMT